MKAIKIKHTTKGKKRAYYYSRKQLRWFPIPLADAELLIATEQAYQVSADAEFA
jgi:hypothetical protein